MRTFVVNFIVTAWQGDLTTAFSERREKVNFTDLELQECLWCRLLVHPMNGYVTVNHIPAMTMSTWHMRCRFYWIVPNAGLVICSCDIVLESKLAANCRCVHSCCRTVCTELCPYIRVVSVQWAYEPSTSLLSFVVVTERITKHHHGSAHVWVGLDRNGTPAFCLFTRMHLCCHIRLKHAFQAVLCTHLHQAIVQWQSCQGTSIVASYRYRIAYWH